MRITHGLLLAASAVPALATSPPTVDLGYATYQGYLSSYGLNTWKSIRYAAPPVGKRRWQAPVPPLQNNTQITLAVDQPPVCPQSGAAGTPYVYGFNSGPGDEDCLYLNLYAPPNATNLPVLLWIHGGGYALFGAEYDPSPMINTNNNGFITVEIQYRLGAFGFLSSDEVKEHGQTNAGLLDQRFALEWVQEHIAKFGGIPHASPSAASRRGLVGLTRQIIAASAYSPPSYKYNDGVPEQHYRRFAELVGCGAESLDGRFASTFDCLVAAPSAQLQNASGTVSTSGLFGTFGFLPVVDGEFLQERPSLQLSQGRVSGKRILVGNNANDGVPLTNPNVVTRAAFNAYINTTFPLFTAADVAALNTIYQTSTTSPTDNGPRYDTLGTTPPTALNQSEMATGLQQTVLNIFAETTFDCPAKWLAEAFSQPHTALEAWKYQYSVTPAYHGADLNAYFTADEPAWPDAGFSTAFQRMWGQFIMADSPVIPFGVATAGYRNATVPRNGSWLDWPRYERGFPVQMDLNTTGGYLVHETVTTNLSYWVREGEGIVNTFRLVDAEKWEEGRGDRCDFWRAVGARVPQ
ncbi:carboxylesterase family protein [Aspergillus heteromorphus CBS 117.55]|uniref:Carboxylesterase family protein n=1 Tax=Aspergillus heteromorphus CBS 117.55 TaxID=1448321 RepID=A0A317X2Y8_9EURO|nr:carboxylesterase family protein [Aspergillus heteromorphus CBS 117.55]PWY92926.1 carboxylesterase family protein [Aspergillus heteromorphus CBS 117.55]